MTFNPDHRSRRSIRLRDYDYAQSGAYFVTVCTKDRACILGSASEGAILLSDAGRIVESTWNALPTHYPHIELDAFVVMPNHVHGVVFITDVGAGFKPALLEAPALSQNQQHGLFEIVRGFKTFSARQINRIRQTPGVPVWQRSYYERVVRDQCELETIRAYIAENPARWETDVENVEST